jgi:hypothetical protein
VTTTVPRPAPVATARSLGRVGAALAVASATVHVLQADASSLGSVVMLVMALACLPCAWHLWRSPTAAVWGMTAALDVAMLAVHAELLAGASGHAHHGASVWPALALVGSQLVVAGIATLRR